MSEWPLNLVDLEAAAAERLTQNAYDYYRSGAGDEITLARNRSAFDEILLLPHVLCDVSDISLETTLLGSEVAMPVAVAPTAFHGMADPEAEVASATGAAGAGALFCLSTLSNTTLETVAEQAPPSPRWFQLYAFKDRGLTTELARRAEAAGYGAIVLTVDAPVLGRRERDVRNSFSLPEPLTVASVAGRGAVEGKGESGLAAYFEAQLDPSLSWSDVEWLVGVSGLPVVVKGVHRADDALRAVDSGAAAVLVSNHGARQLDTAPATIEMLPAISEAIAGQVEVFVDGGFRRGTDVLKALCLGARGVLLGRPILWGLSLGGAEGVGRVLATIERELREAMALCGAATPEQLSKELIMPPHHGRGSL